MARPLGACLPLEAFDCRLGEFSTGGLTPARQGERRAAAVTGPRRGEVGSAMSLPPRERKAVARFDKV